MVPLHLINLHSSFNKQMLVIMMGRINSPHRFYFGGMEMKEKPFIVYTDDPVSFDERLELIINGINEINRRLDAIESKSWVTTDRLADNSVTGKKIAPFKEW